jgi:hypothetical protein
MQFAVESWSNDYGTPVGFEVNGQDSDSLVSVDVEMAPEDWAPLTPRCAPAASVAFVDGVQQIDARIWTEDGQGMSRMGLCVSFAAGWVRCDGNARVEQALVRRAAFAMHGLGSIDCGGGICYAGVAVADTSQHGLDVQVQRARDGLEVEAAQAVGGADLIVIDGHLSRREEVACSVGYIKTHHAYYLPPELGPIVGRLLPGQRTPVFLLEASQSGYSRYSWYLKLPGGYGHPWAGVVRCEATSSLSPVSAVTAFADLASATLPAFASEQYKDPRAPQNLYPVAGLERELRRRMGDRYLLLRALQRASRRAE